jgi:hypothetical protein
MPETPSKVNMLMQGSAVRKKNRRSERAGDRIKCRSQETGVRSQNLKAKSRSQ